MAISLTADRVRSIIDGARDEKTVLARLKAHKIKYSAVPFSEGYALNIYIPCRTGKIRIYRCCSRSVPFMVQHLTPVTFTYTGVPTFRPSIPVGSQYNGREARA